MMKRYLLSATPLAAMLLLTGCIDDNYDLSNINTTSEVKVDGLIIPVNVKDVTLNSVIDLDENSDVKKEIDPVTGKQIYVYSYSGDFSSDPISIKPFEVKAPVLSPQSIEVNLTGSTSSAPAKRAASSAVHYTVSEMVTDFDYVLTDVEESVTKVADLATPGVTYSTIIKFPASIVNDAEKIEVKDLRIEFPKGLEMAQGYPSIGSYDSATGIVTIADYVIGADGTLPLTLVSTRISIDQPVVNGTIDYNDAITVLGGGELLISPKNGVSPVQSFNLDTQYNMSAFDVTAFSGAIDKPIDGMAVNPILLNDLPSFLSGEGTNLVLANPQLYLALNNPVSQYNLKSHTGLSIIPVRGNSDAQAIELPGGLTINDNKAPGAIYRYVLSPDGADTTPVAGFEDAEKLAYPGLGNVLAGNGLPDKLKVEFATPNVYGDNVIDFPLTSDIRGVSGEYSFRAPLALEEGTIIYYSGTKDDWSSEELDRLHITEMQVTAIATSDIPVGVLLTGEVIDTAGKHIGICEGATLPAMAQDHPVTLTIRAAEGTEISNIDGIYYHATCTVSPDDPAAGEAISPDQNVVLKSVRAKVTGRYLYEDK